MVSVFPYRYRFDELGVELFSDSDRLSYTSLSRSSSLIQFESLERQLQSDSQISGSSPSVYSYEGVNTLSINGPAATHHSQEISEKSFAPIAINLPTIKVTNSPPSNRKLQFTNSNSEPYSSSSTSGSFSSDDCEIHREKKTNEIVNDSSLSSNASSSDGGKASGSTDTTSVPMIQSSENRKKFLNSFRAKNSVDSLSEDSGYCDRDIRSLPAGALSLDSTLPTGNDLEDEEGNVIEEKSILRDLNPMRQFIPRVRTHSDDDDTCYHSMENLNRKFKSRKIDLLSEINIESPARNIQPKATSTKLLKIESPNVHVLTEHKPIVKNKNEENSHQPQSEKLISISLPELSASGDISRRSRSKLNRNSRQFSDELNDQFSSVSSVPEYINASADRVESSDYLSCWTEPTVTDSIASKNFNLYDLNYAHSSTAPKQKIVDISASCANLTLLNYADENEFCYESRQLMSINRSKSQTMSGKVPVNLCSSDDDDDDDAFINSYRSKELSSLLEEISAHFDKNLSILNDRERSYEPHDSVRGNKNVKGDEKVEIKNVQAMKTSPPKPPPRRSQIKTSPNYAAPKNATFDRDPTNLVTTYAQSMEKCNFNVDEPINVYSSRQNLYLTSDEAECSKNIDLPQSTPIKKRNFVSSTPNLNFFDIGMKLVNHYSSTDNTAVGHDHLSPLTLIDNDDIRCTSMKEIPTNSRASSSGILAAHSTAGSKSGLSVSFCPIVSEISWQEHAEDDFSDDVEMDPSGEHSRNDSLVNYYNDDDDDEEEDFDDLIAVPTAKADFVCGDQLSTTHSYLDDENIESETSTPSTSKTFDNETFSTMKSISQKMLVEAQTPSEKFLAAEASTTSSMDRKVNKQSLTTVPHKVASEPSLVPVKSAKNKKSIFSRLSSGFRFSFRGKKNKKLNDGVVHYPSEANNNSGNTNVNKKVDKSQGRQQNSAKIIDDDFIFIPLKDPNDNLKNFHQVDDKLANVSQKLQQREAQLPPMPADRQRTVNQRESPTKHGNQVMGKPPLPKQPPRIVGTTTKRPSTHAPRASSTPRETEADSGEFFNQSMIGDGLKQYYSGRSRTMGTLGAEHKIGLIETNLDTDETIINGKTQSLMELGFGPNGSLANRTGVQVMQDENCAGSGVNTESGRPHKSMEFLLDKENHQRVLVSKQKILKLNRLDVKLSLYVLPYGGR